MATPQDYSLVILLSTDPYIHNANKSSKKVGMMPLKYKPANDVPQGIYKGRSLSHQQQGRPMFEYI